MGVIGWVEKGSPQEDAKNLRKKMRISNIPFASAWRVGRYEFRANALIIYFKDTEKKKAFLSSGKIYLDDDLTTTQ